MTAHRRSVPNTIARRRCHVAAGAILLASGAALARPDVSGNIKWTDNEGVTHAARRINIEIWAANPRGDTLVGLATTDLNGDFSGAVGVPPGTIGYFIIARAENDGVYVSSDGTAATTYRHFGGGTGPAGGSAGDLVIGNATSTERAFCVADGAYTAWYYGTQMRPAAPAQIGYRFPVAGGSFYSSVTQRVSLRATAWREWDVVTHEYSHHLANIDGLDMNPGGAHSSGASNIPARGKTLGTRLAFGEGLATYNGIAAQHVNTVLQNLPAMALVGDTHYQAPALGIDEDVETHFGVAEVGEGDEASVMRIMWDLADAENEPHDRVELGFAGLYDDLNNNIPGVDNLDKVWNYYFTRPGTTDLTRVDFGAIFEEYQVSPHPHDGPIGDLVSTTDPIPTFEWNRQNNAANDSFGLIVFDDAMATRLLNITIPGDVTTYTPTAAQWALVMGAPFGAKYFVIRGADAIAPDGSAYSGDEITGAYWSDAYGFATIPTPGALALLGLGALSRRRRR